MSGDRIILTEGLVRGLRPREVDAVIAHELGHHKAGHLRWRSSGALFGVYLVAVAPLGAGCCPAIITFLLGFWLFLFFPLAFIVMQGLFSQRRELAADARAAGESPAIRRGKIAALGRLAQLSRMPVAGRGISALDSDAIRPWRAVFWLSLA